MSCRSNYQPKTWLGPRQESAGRRSYSQWRSKPRARRYRLSTPKRPGSQWVPTATPWSHWAKTRNIQPARSRPEEDVYRYLGLPAKIHYLCNRTSRWASAFVPPPCRQTREPAARRILERRSRYLAG